MKQILLIKNKENAAFLVSSKAEWFWLTMKVCHQAIFYFILSARENHNNSSSLPMRAEEMNCFIPG